MKKSVLLFVCILSLSLSGQTDSNWINGDSVNLALMKEYRAKVAAIELQRKEDSVKRINLELEIAGLQTTDNLKKEELQNKLDQIAAREVARFSDKKARIDSLRTRTNGFPVIGVLHDTLFMLYAKSGALTAYERSAIISKKI